MSAPKLIPFVLEQALTGHPCCTRDGELVDTIVDEGDYLKVILRNGLHYRCFRSGNYSRGISPRDLFLMLVDVAPQPKTVTKWVNVYEESCFDSEGQANIAHIHDIQCARQLFNEKVKRLGGKAHPIEIEVTE